MKTEQAAALLGRTTLFGGLEPEWLEHVSERALERSYKKGQLIFHEGDQGDSLYVIIEGLVKVFVTSEQGDEMVLVTLGPAETFGELAMVDGGPRSASAEAVEPTRLLVLTRPTLLELLEQRPQLTDALLRSLGGLVRRLTEQGADLVFLDLHGRVAKLLIRFARERGEVSDGDTILDLHLTQTDLAAMVGGSRQSVNHILKSFEGRGYLEVRGRQIVLKRTDLLERRAGG